MESNYQLSPLQKKKRIGYELTSCLPQLLCPQRKRQHTPKLVSMLDRKALKKATPKTRRTDEKNGKITFGSSSITGWKPDNPDWICQDDCCIMNTPVDDKLDTKIFMLFDGHGPFGHLVSRRCRDVFGKILIDSKFDAKSAFKLIHEDMEKGPIDVSCSGTTSVVAWIQNGNILKVAHVGDSKALLVRSMEGGKLVPIALTNDHKPDSPNEAKRIKKMGGQVYSSTPQVPTNYQGPPIVPGPPRVWYYNPEKSNMMGLAMSRSLGDSLAHQAGVSHEPDEMTQELDEADEFIILASDGVWDVCDEKLLITVTEYIYNLECPEEWDPKEASNLLVKAARQRWEKGSTIIDDITCIIIKLREKSKDVNSNENTIT